MGDQLGLTVRGTFGGSVTIPFFISGGGEVGVFSSSVDDGNPDTLIGQDEALGLHWAVSSSVVNTADGPESVGLSLGAAYDVGYKVEFVLGGMSGEPSVSFEYSIFAGVGGITFIVPSEINPDNWNGFGIALTAGPSLGIELGIPTTSQDIPLLTFDTTLPNGGRGTVIVPNPDGKTECFLAGTPVSLPV
jgi:hypothetical protein